MNWLDRIFNRQERPPSALSTSYGETIRRLAATDDAVERNRLAMLLATQLEGAFSGSANNVQVALWQVEERIRDRQGETNDLVSEAVSLIRGQGAALDAARAEFRSGLSEIGERLTSVEADVADVKQELKASKNDRAQLNARLGNIEQELKARPSLEETAELIALIWKHEAEYQATHREASDAAE